MNTITKHKSSSVSMLERQWSSGCNASQPNRSHIIICAKRCSVPGGIETLIKRAPSASGSHDLTASSYGGARHAMNSFETATDQQSQNAPYPHEPHVNNPVSGSISGKARSFAGKVMKAAKGTADKVERQMAEMALRYADQSKTQEMATAVCLVSQPILASYPGSARYEEWDKTEEVTLCEEHEDDIVWAVPILLPEAIPGEMGKVSLLYERNSILIVWHSRSFFLKTICL